MHTIRVYDNTGATVYKTLFDAKVVSYSRRVSAPGRGVFTIPVGSTNAEADNLRKYRVVTIERDGVLDWIGYIEAHKRTSPTQYTVYCWGMLNLFRKRFTANDEVFNGQGSVEAYGLLTDTNTNDGNTGVTSGTTTVTSTKNLKATGRKDILTMWTEMATAHGAEFEITTSRVFNFAQSIGSDKSGTVTLRFRRDGEPGNNVVGFEEGEDGEPMANRIIGTTTAGGGLTFTYNDTASQAIYPVLIEAKQFNEAQDIGTLTSMATNYGIQKANPITDNEVSLAPVQTTIDILTGQPVVSGVQYGHISLGDLVMCDFETETQSIQEARRIAEIIVDVDPNGQETVRYTLSKSGVFITSNLLDSTRVTEITRRIQDIERLL